MWGSGLVREAAAGGRHGSARDRASIQRRMCGKAAEAVPDLRTQQVATCVEETGCYRHGHGLCRAHGHKPVGVALWGTERAAGGRQSAAARVRSGRRRRGLRDRGRRSCAPPICIWEYRVLRLRDRGSLPPVLGLRVAHLRTRRAHPIAARPIANDAPRCCLCYPRRPVAAPCALSYSGVLHLLRSSGPPMTVAARAEVRKRAWHSFRTWNAGRRAAVTHASRGSACARAFFFLVSDKFRDAGRHECRPSQSSCPRLRAVQRPQHRRRPHRRRSQARFESLQNAPPNAPRRSCRTPQPRCRPGSKGKPALIAGGALVSPAHDVRAWRNRGPMRGL